MAQGGIAQPMALSGWGGRAEAHALVGTKLESPEAPNLIC